MKRSRRVVLTLMGGAVISAISVGLDQVKAACGTGLQAVRGSDGKTHCGATRGGFGSTPQQIGGRDPGDFGGS
jgi:hypothetical protein